MTAPNENQPHAGHGCILDPMTNANVLDRPTAPDVRPVSPADEDVQRYTKAIYGVANSHDPIRAVLALRDEDVAAAVEAATADLRAERDAAREDASEYDGILSRQGDLLTRTANVLRGDPPALTSWSHHDIPELAQAMVSERDAARAALATLAAVVEQVRALADEMYASSEGHEWQGLLAGCAHDIRALLPTGADDE